MKELSKVAAVQREIDADSSGQRIDNYLLKVLKGVPKSHVYRILRSGEVRVNSGRVDAGYRLRQGDRIRIPPVRTAAAPVSKAAVRVRVQPYVIFEDECLLAIDKPSGMAVHGGSGISSGAVEQLRAERPEARFLELVHRLDRDTSGVLLLAKKRSALTDLHRQLREGLVEKHYLALVKGHWSNRRQNVKLPLNKYVSAAGERRVSVHAEGQFAHTVISLERAWRDVSLVDAELKTGRTHQIRVHLAHLGFPIAGDDKYGDFEWNRALAKNGLKRMFLHARRMAFAHPASGGPVVIEAPLPPELGAFLGGLGTAPRAPAKDRHD